MNKWIVVPFGSWWVPALFVPNGHQSSEGLIEGTAQVDQSKFTISRYSNEIYPNHPEAHLQAYVRNAEWVASLVKKLADDAVMLLNR